ncbi:MAG: MFS transporter [Mesonia sp.]|uniref:MFS transporter n=1 Tax=Mesonia sp. TaxID=1960830 RepID=UPI003F98D5E7
MSHSKSNRWFIAIMATQLQVILGTVYAWSFFQKPIMLKYGWSNVETMWIFSISILFLGLSAAVGGRILPKFGPKKLATIGALLYGLGLGYVTPVATVSKWFPDKKGLVTGMVVMGFGLGALVMSKLIAPLFLEIANDNIIEVFIYISICLIVLGTMAGLCMKNPPEGFIPDDYQPESYESHQQESGHDLSLKSSLLSKKFLGMWLIFFLNISAGIMFISLQSPMIQDLLLLKDASISAEELSIAGASLIAISSLFNGVGRFFWGGISDKIGRIQVFRLFLASQIIVFILMIYTENPWIFGALVCYVLLCYGGGFGAMPSYVLDVFHAKLMPVVYGVILTAWSIGGIVGPQVAAFIRDYYANTPELIGSRTYIAGTILLGLGFIISLMLSNKSITES